LNNKQGDIEMVASLGSVSRATMREEDLIPAFAYELEQLDTEEKYKELIKEANDIDWDDVDIGIVYSNDILEELFDALNMFAPPYCYFGSHPGDGADYGFWICEDIESIFEGLKVNDVSEVPEDYTGEVFDSNEHGNMVLYYYENTTRGIEAKEIWSNI
jgi:hypothetical protein